MEGEALCVVALGLVWVGHHEIVEQTRRFQCSRAQRRADRLVGERRRLQPQTRIVAMAPVDPEPGQGDPELQAKVCGARRLCPGDGCPQVCHVLVEPSERLRIGRPALDAGHRLGGPREIFTMTSRELVSLGDGQPLGGEFLHGLEQHEAIVPPPMHEALVDQR